MKGLIVFYVNHYPEKNQDPLTMIDLVKTHNKAVIDKLIGDGYEIVYVPTTNESTRVERIHFEGSM